MRGLFVVAIFTFIFICAVYYLSDVKQELTSEDRSSIESLNLGNDCHDLSTFESELHCVTSIQKKLMTIFPSNSSPRIETLRAPHEPTIILNEKWGSCYDRSRVIEKTLTYFGLKSRHVSIHRLHRPWPWGYFFAAESHAFSEVLTKKGWMIVGSLTLFVGLDKDRNPIKTSELRHLLKSGKAEEELITTPSHDYFQGNFSYVYGLYSRHGQFFPPFVPIPDIDWSQIFYNFYI